MSTVSNNSNESMPDESIEVIGPEDLEDSPPPADVEVIGAIKDIINITGDSEENSASITDKEQATNTVVASTTEDNSKMNDSNSANADGDKAVPVTDNSAKVDTVVEDPPVEKLAAKSDDPPLEILAPPRVEPVPPVVQPPPQVVTTRPTVTPARPAATLEEEDDEEDDDDIDETLVERLIGLTEMFPQFVRNGSVGLVKGSWSLSQSSFSFAKAATWVVFSTATILFMPVMLETERLQLQDQQKAQKNQILLGPGMAQSGGPSLGPPPI